MHQEVRYLHSEQDTLKERKPHYDKMQKKETCHKMEMKKVEQKFDIERKLLKQEQSKIHARARKTIKSMQKKQDDLQEEIIRMKDEQIKFWKGQAESLQALTGLVPIIQIVLARK